MLCHNTTVLSQCLVLTPRANCCIRRALYWCSCAINRCMGRKVEVEETASHKFWYLPNHFGPPSKWRPWHEPCLPYPRYATAKPTFVLVNDESIPASLAEKKQISRIWSIQRIILHQFKFFLTFSLLWMGGDLRSTLMEEPVTKALQCRPAATSGHSGQFPPIFCVPKFCCVQKSLF